MAKSVTKFNRIFDPEFLQARKDVTPVMLHAAQGDVKKMTKELEDNPFLMGDVNNDGNSLLLLAVANGRDQCARVLMELKADILHQNCMKMDALDYSAMEGVSSPICKAVLQYCDYVTPQISSGYYGVRCEHAIAELRQMNVVCARTDLLGRTPDFEDMFTLGTEYRQEWVANLRYMAAMVKKGVILLDDDIQYLEKDAMLSGAMEVRIANRFVYRDGHRNVHSFSHVLKHHYMHHMDLHMMEACGRGDAMAVQGLLKASAKPNITDKRGQTLLMKAAHQGAALVMKCLLQARAQVNTTTTEGYSAICLAAVRGHEAPVRLLIQSKADLTARSFKGASVFDFVKHEGKSRILMILKEERAKQVLLKATPHHRR